MDVIDSPLSARLKKETHATHDRLDRSIMEAASFSSLDGYRRFLRVQCAFHQDIDALYADPGLQALLPGLVERRRLPLIEADLADLGEGAFAPAALNQRIPDLATALGWLYVAEGSNLGAALLRKEAARLGLSDMRGARHLAPAAEGPAVHWRRFKAALDTASLTDAEVDRAIGGANAAFARVQALLDAELG
jgi:heme oxygenase (biliverdin-IX-beta and delta-forming)